eukprot:2241023-Amphidinium_carterae.2
MMFTTGGATKTTEQPSPPGTSSISSSDACPHCSRSTIWVRYLKTMSTYNQRHNKGEVPDDPV